jgi:hypothetical protein
MSVILLTLKRKKREQEGEREIIAFLSIGKAKGNKKRLKERKRRRKMERIESKSIISIFTILYTRLILSANRSNDRERKRSKNVALNRRNRESERLRLFLRFLFGCMQEKKARKIIIYKSSTGCMQ